MISHSMKVERGKLLMGATTVHPGTPNERYVIHISEYDWKAIHGEIEEGSSITVALDPTQQMFNLSFVDKDLANRIFLSLVPDVAAPF